MSSLETNQEYSKILEDNVKLTCKAVAVKLLEPVKKSFLCYDLIDEKVRHCEMIRKSMTSMEKNFTVPLNSNPV